MKAALDGPVDLVAETALESDELAKLLESAQAKQAALKNDLAAKEQALLRRTERIPAAKEELRDAQAAILDLKKEVAGMGGERGTTLGEARLAALRAALLLKQAQVPALTAELAAQPALLSLAQHQRDAARLELALSERRVKALDELVGKRRIADAEATQAGGGAGVAGVRDQAPDPARDRGVEEPAQRGTVAARDRDPPRRDAARRVHRARRPDRGARREPAAAAARRQSERSARARAEQGDRRAARRGRLPDREPRARAAGSGPDRQDLPAGAGGSPVSGGRRQL